ncbi:MAG: DUF1015 domain-containing protein, partial [Bacteroidetes bacterium]|nr:DUF1015 domain-containing protein [Bacteroidota bacterium]
MPSIKPFKALRPTAENAQDFSASAYNSDDNFKKAKRYNQSELFYLNIRRPQAFHKKITEEDSFAFSKDIVAKAQESWVLVNDDKDCFYIYSQRKGSRTFTGIIALASIDDLVNNKIKKHEHTRVDKEDLMAKYFQNVGINGNPILLTHEPTNDIDDLLKAAVIAKPIVDFTTPADTQHCLWKIEDENLIASITEAYKKLDSFYISDGHHRCAAYKKLSPQPDGLMAFIIPANQLKVFSFHRIIYNLGGVKRNELIEKISAIFKVEKLEEISQPKKEGEIHL